MTPLETRVQAVKALSGVLSDNEITHALTRGFAANLLSHHRETVDVDVEIDVAKATEVRD